MVWYPRAPSGGGGVTRSSCTAPVPSVARTEMTCCPGAACQAYFHCTHAWGPKAAVERVASRHASSSIFTSTFEMPRSGAHATPATGTSPAGTPELGTSMRDCVRIGAFLDHPRGTQYASKASSVVSSSYASHLVADT